jgi:hypothetical protein
MGLPMRLPLLLNTLAGTAATVGCLLALPAFADTAAQSVEHVAKQLSSSDGAIGRLVVDVAAHNITACSACLSIAAFLLQVRWAMRRFEKD